MESYNFAGLPCVECAIKDQDYKRKVQELQENLFTLKEKLGQSEDLFATHAAASKELKEVKSKLRSYGTKLKTNIARLQDALMQRNYFEKQVKETKENLEAVKLQLNAECEQHEATQQLNIQLKALVHKKEKNKEEKKQRHVACLTRQLKAATSSKAALMKSYKQKIKEVMQSAILITESIIKEGHRNPAHQKIIYKWKKELKQMESGEAYQSEDEGIFSPEVPSSSPKELQSDDDQVSMLPLNIDCGSIASGDKYETSTNLTASKIKSSPLEKNGPVLLVAENETSVKTEISQQNTVVEVDLTGVDNGLLSDGKYFDLERKYGFSHDAQTGSLQDLCESEVKTETSQQNTVVEVDLTGAENGLLSDGKDFDLEYNGKSSLNVPDLPPVNLQQDFYQADNNEDNSLRFSEDFGHISLQEKPTEIDVEKLLKEMTSLPSLVSPVNPDQDCCMEVARKDVSVMAVNGTSNKAVQTDAEQEHQIDSSPGTSMSHCPGVKQNIYISQSSGQNHDRSESDMLRFDYVKSEPTTKHQIINNYENVLKTKDKEIKAYENVLSWVCSDEVSENTGATSLDQVLSTKEVGIEDNEPCIANATADPSALTGMNLSYMKEMPAPAGETSVIKSCDVPLPCYPSATEHVSSMGQCSRPQTDQVPYVTQCKMEGSVTDVPSCSSCIRNCYSEQAVMNTINRTDCCVSLNPPSCSSHIRNCCNQHAQNTTNRTVHCVNLNTPSCDSHIRNCCNAEALMSIINRSDHAASLNAPSCSSHITNWYNEHALMNTLNTTNQCVSSLLQYMNSQTSSNELLPSLINFVLSKSASSNSDRLPSASVKKKHSPKKMRKCRRILDTSSDSDESIQVKNCVIETSDESDEKSSIVTRKRKWAEAVSGNSTATSNIQKKAKSCSLDRKGELNRVTEPTESTPTAYKDRVHELFGSFSDAESDEEKAVNKSKVCDASSVQKINKKLNSMNNLYECRSENKDCNLTNTVSAMPPGKLSKLQKFRLNLMKAKMPSKIVSEPTKSPRRNNKREARKKTPSYSCASEGSKTRPSVKASSIESEVSQSHPNDKAPSINSEVSKAHPNDKASKIRSEVSRARPNHKAIIIEPLPAKVRIAEKRKTMPETLVTKENHILEHSITDLKEPSSEDAKSKSMDQISAVSNEHDKSLEPSNSNLEKGSISVQYESTPNVISPLKSPKVSSICGTSPITLINSTPSSSKHVRSLNIHEEWTPAEGSEGQHMLLNSELENTSLDHKHPVSDVNTLSSEQDMCKSLMQIPEFPITKNHDPVLETSALEKDISLIPTTFSESDKKEEPVTPLAVNPSPRCLRRSTSIQRESSLPAGNIVHHVFENRWCTPKKNASRMCNANKGTLNRLEIKRRVRAQIRRVGYKTVCKRETFADIIRELGKLEGDYALKYVGKCILKYLCFERPIEEFLGPKSVDNPCMPLREKTSTLLVFRLQADHEQYKSLPKVILDGIQYHLLRLGHAPEFKILTIMTRFYAILCSLCLSERECKEHLMKLCYDALYCLTCKAYLLMNILLTVYPDFFPHANQNCMFATLMVSLLAMDKKHDRHDHTENNVYCNRPDKGRYSCKLKNLRLLMKQRFGYKSVPDSKTILNSLVHKLKNSDDEPVPLLRSSFILLAKKIGCTETFKNIISSVFYPMIDDWKQHIVADKVAEQVILILGYITRCFSSIREAAKTQDVLNKLKSILEDDSNLRVSPEVHEATMLSLIRLSRNKHSYRFVADIILTWKPKHGKYSEELLEAIRSFVFQQKFVWWTKFIKDRHK